MTEGSLERGPFRIDPCHSKAFSWMEWFPHLEPLSDEQGRFVRPGSPVLRVRYRYNGAEWEFWPVSEDEWREVSNPGQKYGYSIGSAFSQIVKAHKSGRMVKAGEKQAKSPEAKPARRWLA